MTPEAFQRALRSFTRRRPFLSFHIELVNGDQFRVTHPEAVQVRGSLVFHVASSGHQRLFDSTSVCQLLDEKPQPPLPTMDEDGPAP